MIFKYYNKNNSKYIFKYMTRLQTFKLIINNLLKIINPYSIYPINSMSIKILIVIENIY